MNLQVKLHSIFRWEILGLLFVGITAEVRLAVLSQEHLYEARQARLSGNLPSALESYTWAIRNYFPANPYISPALDESQNLIETLHREGKIDEEIKGLRQLQAALLSIRSFTQPYKKSLKIIEEKLSRISYVDPISS